MLIQVLLDVNTPLKRKEDRIGKWGMGYDPLQVQEIGNLLLPLWDGGTLGWLLTNIVLILWSHGHRELGNGGTLVEGANTEGRWFRRGKMVMGERKGHS